MRQREGYNRLHGKEYKVLNMKNNLLTVSLTTLMAIFLCSSAQAGDFNLGPAQKILQNARPLIKAKRYPDAIRILKQGLEDAKKSGNVQAQSLLNIELMNLYVQSGDYKASQEIGKQLVRDSQQLDDRVLGATPSADLQKAREADIQNMYADVGHRPDEQTWTKKKQLLQNLIDQYEKSGRYDDAMPSYNNLFAVCLDQYGYYHPETLKVVKAHAMAQRHTHYPTDLAETEKLAIEIEKGLKSGKRGGHPSFSATIHVK